MKKKKYNDKIIWFFQTAPHLISFNINNYNIKNIIIIIEEEENLIFIFVITELYFVSFFIINIIIIIEMKLNIVWVYLNILDYEWMDDCIDKIYH